MGRFTSMGLGALLLLSPITASAMGSSEPEPEQPAALTRAIEEVKAGRYQDAIRSLTSVVRNYPRNADAYNYLGYAHRKLGQFDPSLTNYLKALELDPDHRAAHEYLGELYLQMGDLQKAEAQADRLSRLCFFGCDELRELRAAIEAYRERAGT